jgi:TctA family transporter
MEKTLRQSLFMTRGDWLEIVGRPLSAILLALGALALVGPPLVRLARRRRRRQARPQLSGVPE